MEYVKIAFISILAIGCTGGVVLELIEGRVMLGEMAISEAERSEEPFKYWASIGVHVFICGFLVFLALHMWRDMLT